MQRLLMEILKNPDCPKCKKPLSTLRSDTQLCSYPPYSDYKCDYCEFAGYVMMQFTEQYDKYIKETPVKFVAGDPRITNKAWIDNLIKLNG